MDHMIAFQRAESAYKLVNVLVETFPKIQRFGLGLRLESNSIELIELIATGETLPNPLKGKFVSEAAAKADVCGVLTRLCAERKLIGGTNYFTLAGLFQETAMLCTGWEKSLR